MIVSKFVQCFQGKSKSSTQHDMPELSTYLISHFNAFCFLFVFDNNESQMKPEEEPWRSETLGNERKRVSFTFDLYLHVLILYLSMLTDMCNIILYNSKLKMNSLVAVCNRPSKRSQPNVFLCMDLTYIICLLKDGFGFKESTVLQVR